MNEWTPGLKHPETNILVFKNCYEYDRVRRVLIARCKKCGQVVSTDEQAVKELVFPCSDPNCYCKKSLYATKVHRVCTVCYDMWHSLYMNAQLKNMNYWKELDEKDKRDGGEGRRRMGMGDKS